MKIQRQRFPGTFKKWKETHWGWDLEQERETEEETGEGVPVSDHAGP